jgi:hypothetical protein
MANGTLRADAQENAAQRLGIDKQKLMTTLQLLTALLTLTVHDLPTKLLSLSPTFSIYRPNRSTTQSIKASHRMVTVATTNPFMSLRMVYSSATSIASSLPGYEVPPTPPATTKKRKEFDATTNQESPSRTKPRVQDKYCRRCAADGKPNVIFTTAHWTEAHGTPRRERLNKIKEEFSPPNVSLIANALGEREYLAKIEEIADEIASGWTRTEPLYAIQEKSNKESSNYSSFSLTPVTMDEFSAIAMVDTGANPSFISSSFCISNAINITPDSSKIKISRAGLLEPKLGTATVSVSNGTERYLNLIFTVLDKIEFDMILGRNYHQIFGYKLVGVPTKPPGPQITEPDALIPPVTLEDIIPTPVTYPPLIEALTRNSEIDILQPCTHPLAKWNLSFTEEPTYWSRHNYQKQLTLR